MSNFKPQVNNLNFDQTIGNGGATLRAGWSQDHPDLKKKYIYIYNKKKLFKYPLKKNFGNTLNFFYTNKIKFCSIICSTFKQKKKSPIFLN